MKKVFATSGEHFCGAEYLHTFNKYEFSLSFCGRMRNFLHERLKQYNNPLMHFMHKTRSTCEKNSEKLSIIHHRQYPFNESLACSRSVALSINQVHLIFNLANRVAFIPPVSRICVQTSVSVKRINKFMNGEELDPNNVQHDESESE